MKLSVLERMIKEGDMSLDGIRYLIQARTECEWLDYKEKLKLEEDLELCNFTKDVLAIKNIGGGYIIVGVKDKTWEPIGIENRLPYDTKMVRDKVQRGSGLDIDVDLVHHDVQVNDHKKLFALIYIRSSKKRKKLRSPSEAKKDFCQHKPFGIRRGDIYARRGDSTVRITSQKELEELLDNLEAQVDEDTLQSSTHPSPFAIQDGTYRLLETGFESFIGRKELRNNLLRAVTHDPRIWIINVHGPGGVGKSALVNWAAYEFYRERTFEAIIHLTAKETVLTTSGIRKYTGRSLYSLETLLDHILDTFQESTVGDIETKKKIAIEYLSAWKTLLILDNMETVSDNRILNFVREFPIDTRAKVLLTSREKTGGWELPIPVMELNPDEVKEFLQIKSAEMGVNFPLTEQICEGVRKVSGGLPLAIQWIIGQFKVSGDMDRVLTTVNHKDSPILEFSFRNIWDKLQTDAQIILVVMTIFDEPPTVQQISIATEWRSERIEKALSDLEDVTLVTKVIQSSDGKIKFVVLPITLSFARNQLDTIGDFEAKCRQRLQKFHEQMTLQQTEVTRFGGVFERYGLTTDNEKKAAILCRRGESEMFIGNVDNADTLFKQARELAPNSAYVFAMSASYELGRNHLGPAIDYAKEACKRANKKTGALCYTIKARALATQGDKNGRVEALHKAIEFDPYDVVIRHQYGVALSKANRTDDAIQEFTKIIDKEKSQTIPSETLIMSLKTRIINLRRNEKYEDAARDLAFAKEILRKYPHLSHQTQHVAELEDDQ